MMKHNIELYHPSLMNGCPSLKKKHKEANLYFPSFMRKVPTNRGLNKDFSYNGENYDTDGEFELLDSLLKEHIQQHGYIYTYILRTNHTMDEIYGESIGANFKHSFQIEMMPSESSNLMTTTDAILGLGFQKNTMIKLDVNANRIIEEIKRMNMDKEHDAFPYPGDLIYWNMTNQLYEIKHIEDDNFWIKGRKIMYSLTCQMYNLSDETFDTDIEQIDILNQFQEEVQLNNNNNHDYEAEVQDTIINEPNIWDLQLQGNYVEDKKIHGKKKTKK